MAAPTLFAPPHPSSTPRPATPAVASRFGVILVWSASAVVIGSLLVPLGALHALSHVLEVRREGGSWRTSFIALLLGAALVASGSGPRLVFETTHDSSTAAVMLSVAHNEVARTQITLRLDNEWSLSATARMGGRGE